MAFCLPTATFIASGAQVLIEGFANDVKLAGRGHPLSSFHPLAGHSGCTGDSAFLRLRSEPT